MAMYPLNDDTHALFPHAYAGGQACFLVFQKEYLSGTINRRRKRAVTGCFSFSGLPFLKMRTPIFGKQ
jgi:hypothetical protein